MKAQPTVKELLEMLHKRVPDFFDRNTKQKEWIGLTDEERNELLSKADWMYDPESYAVLVEAKLKEKNT